jgi:hypothetical protein
MHLSHHEAVTASYAGLAGFKNGALLRAVTEAGFDVLVTGDKTLQYEQNLTGLQIAIVSLSANSWKLVLPHIPRIVAAVDLAKPGSIQKVDCGAFTRRRPKPQTPGIG